MMLGADLIGNVTPPPPFPVVREVGEWESGGMGEMFRGL